MNNKLRDFTSDKMGILGVHSPQFKIQQVFTQAQMSSGSKPWHLVNIKIAGKWMFIPLKMVLIGIDP